MASKPTTGLTYQDLLEMFPEEDNVRRELIGGELIVAPSPSTRHQGVVVRLIFAIETCAREHGGQALTGPYDVKFSDRDVVEPDVLFVTAEHVNRFKERFIDAPPDIVIEVSSSSTRSLDLGRKLQLYERSEVPEYWFVDLDADRLEIYRLEKRRYGPPVILRTGEVLESSLLPGFRLAVDDVLSPR